MRTSKTPLPPTPSGSQPSAVQVWPAQCTRVHVQADHFNEPHGGSQRCGGKGRQRRAGQPRRLGDWGQAGRSLRITERGQSQEERPRRAQEGGSRVQEDTLCLEEPVGHQKLLSGFSSVVCRGQQSITWGPTRGGPRHSWAGLEFWAPTGSPV